MNMIELLRKNRSYRRFESTPVTERELEELIEAASLTASAGNWQQLRFWQAARSFSRYSQ